MDDDAKGFDKRQHRFVHGQIGLAVDQLARLGLDRSDHSRVTMAGVRHGDAASEIEIAPAVPGVQITAQAVSDDEVGVTRLDRGDVIEGGLAHVSPLPLDDGSAEERRPRSDGPTSSQQGIGGAFPAELALGANPRLPCPCRAPGR